MIEIRRNDKQAGILLTYNKFIDATVGRRIEATVKNSNFDEPTYNEKSVGTSLMQTPSAVPANKRRGDVDLNDRTANDIPTGAGSLCKVAVFVRDRAGRTENKVVNRRQSELSFVVDRRLLCYQLFVANHVGRVALR